jgi:hypothetical protein
MSSSSSSKAPTPKAWGGEKKVVILLDLKFS